MKKIVGWFIVLLLVLYIAVSLWMGNSARNIIQKAMENNTDYSSVMTDDVYNKINPQKRGMNYSNFNKGDYSSKFAPALHYFLGGHVRVPHQYETKDIGFKETVLLDLTFVNGKWKAIDVYIKP